MQRVALLLCAVAAVSAVIVETNTDAPIMIPRAGDAPVMTRAFVARGGRAAQLELTTLLIDDKPVARVRHVEGDLTGSETEVVITLASLSSRRVRDWFREYVDAQYKKHDIAVVTKTKDTGAGSTTDAPLSFSKHILKGSLITEITFPSFGVTDGTVKVKLLYSSSEEVKNVKSVPVAEAPIRTEFFKLSLKNGDKDKAGAAMAKSVFRLGGFSLLRVKGFGKSSPTKIGAFFRAGSDRASALSRWNDWYTSKESHYVGGGGVTTKSRDGSIVLYYWSGSTMDATMGESSRGQLKKLFELKLKDITLSAMDSNEGRVTLSVDTIEMAEH